MHFVIAVPSALGFLFAGPILPADPGHFSLSEKLTLAALILTSAGLFWKRFGIVLDKILKSRKDPGFHLGNIGKRIWDFFWEVICQAKVIRERPLPGLAHAFVFWGFCVFGLITLNHFSTALGFPFLNNWFGEAYDWFARVFAVLVAISILGL